MLVTAGSSFDQQIFSGNAITTMYELGEKYCPKAMRKWADTLPYLEDYSEHAQRFAQDMYPLIKKSIEMELAWEINGLEGWQESLDLQNEGLKYWNEQPDMIQNNEDNETYELVVMAYNTIENEIGRRVIKIAGLRTDLRNVQNANNLVQPAHAELKDVLEFTAT